MRKREKNLIIALILMPIICIITMIIGSIFNITKIVVGIIATIVLFAIILKICMALISAYRSNIKK